jgi:phosphoglycolate phosphatase
MANRPEITLKQFRAEFRLPFKSFYDRFTPNISLKQLESWFHGRFREIQDQVQELPYARQFLQFCQANRLRTFILSTMREDHFRIQAQRTGFIEFLDRPYLGIWDKRNKIKELLQENHLSPPETLLVGDMEHDIETAHHGGVHSCAVLTGYNEAEQLRRCQPHILVEHLGELQSVLEEKNFNLPSPSDSCKT